MKIKVLVLVNRKYIIVSLEPVISTPNDTHWVKINNDYYALAYKPTKEDTRCYITKHRLHKDTIKTLFAHLTPNE